MKKIEYTKFVHDIITCVLEHYIHEENKLGILAEGVADYQQYSGTQEYAVLRNEQAELFVDSIHRNSELLGIEKSEYRLRDSKLLKTERKYVHSCYPKNLRRWMNGTVSRKKRCRVELCTLLFCWSDCWNTSDDQQCRNAMVYICDKYLQTDKKEFSFAMLWNTMESLYRQ